MMHSYFYGKFRSQLSLLEFKQPNSVVRDFMGDDSIVFFGGRDWENVGKDLSLIPAEDRPKFILSLFMIVLTDQCLYARWQDVYPTWRKQTNFPKFGWSGFGPHNENPIKILWAPERENVIKVDEVLELLPEFVTLMAQEVKSFFASNLLTMQETEFFESIKCDYALTFDEGAIVKDFKREFQAQI